MKAIGILLVVGIVACAGDVDPSKPGARTPVRSIETAWQAERDTLKAEETERVNTLINERERVLDRMVDGWYKLVRDRMRLELIARAEFPRHPSVPQPEVPPVGFQHKQQPCVNNGCMLPVPVAQKDTAIPVNEWGTIVSRGGWNSEQPVAIRLPANVGRWSDDLMFEFLKILANDGFQYQKAGHRDDVLVWS